MSTTANDTLSTSASTATTPAGVASAQGRRRSQPYVILGAIVALAGACYMAFHHFTAGRENTDDAQVATDMVPIAARVGGLVVDVPVVDNQLVKTGDLLVAIDPAEYELKVKSATAELDAARAQAEVADAQMQIVSASSKGGLSTARAALTGSAASVHGADAQIAAARAARARAQADADKADTDLRRAQSLRKDDAIPQAQVDSLVATAAAAHAAVAQSEAQLTAAEEAKRTAQSRIGEAEGRVEQSAPVDAQVAAAKANAELAHARVQSASSSLDQAKLQLSYTRVVAPADGHVSKLGVHAGQLVQPSFVLTNVLPLATYVIANYKETQVGAMRAGQPATVSVDAFPGRELHAKVESVAFGTGAQFSLLPPDNASGNFVKVVQRVPVKLVWVDLPSDVRLESGLSVDATVDVR